MDALFLMSGRGTASAFVAAEEKRSGGGGGGEELFPARPPFQAAMSPTKKERDRLIMATYVRSIPPLQSISGAALPAQIAQLRKFLPTELKSIKLLQSWHQGSFTTNREAWEFFQEVSPYACSLSIDGLNLFGRLILRASTLLSEMLTLFSRDSADQIKLKLFSSLFYFDESFRSPQYSLEYLKDVNEYIQKIQHTIQGTLHAQNVKRYKPQLTELTTILTFLEKGLNQESAFLVLLQPLSYQSSIEAKLAKTSGNLRDEENILPQFFLEFVREAHSLACLCKGFIQEEKSKVGKLFKSQQVQKEVIKQWSKDVDRLLDGLETYWIEPLNDLEKELRSLVNQIRELHTAQVNDHYLSQLKKRAEQFCTLKERCNRICDHFEEKFNPAQKVMPLMEIMRSVTKGLSPSVAKEMIPPFFYNLALHLSTYVGRFYYILQTLLPPLTLAEQSWSELYRVFALRVEILFPKEPLVCESRYISESSLVLGMMRALVKQLTQHLKDEKDVPDCVMFLQKINCLEEVFADLSQFKEEQERFEEMRERFESILQFCKNVCIPICMEKSTPQGQEILVQLREGCESLQKALIPLKGEPPNIGMVLSLLCSRSDNEEITAPTFVFFTRELKIVLWALQTWNQLPVEVDEVPLKALEMLPPIIKVEIRTYIEQLNHIIQRFRHILFVLQTTMEATPPHTQKDVLQIVEAIEKTQDKLIRLDFESIIEEIKRVLDEYGIFFGGDHIPAISRFTEIIARQMDGLEEFFMNSILLPISPMRRWAEIERLFAEKGSPGGARVAPPSPLLKPRSDSDLDVEESGAVEDGKKGGAAEEDKRGDRLSFQKLFFALTGWVSREEGAFRTSGLGVSLQPEAMQLRGRQGETLENVRFYLRSLEEWLEEGKRCPLSCAKGVLSNVAMTVEQTLKFLLIQTHSKDVQALLDTHSIAELLFALPRASLLSPEESLHLIHLGRFITAGYRNLDNGANPQVSLLRRILRLQRESEDVEVTQAQIVGIMEEARGQVVLALQALAKLYGEDLDALSGSPPLADAAQREEEPIVAQKRDVEFQQRVIEQLKKMEAVLAKRGSARKAMERGNYSSKVEERRQRLLDQSRRAISTSVEAIRGVSVHAHQPRYAFTRSLATLVESATLFEHTVKWCLARRAISQKQNPYDHILWEPNGRKERLWVYEHRLFDLWKLLKSHTHATIVTREQETVLEVLNGFIGTHRYLGSYKAGVADLFHRLSSLSYCYRQLEAGWILPAEEQKRLEELLGGEKDRQKWLGAIQVEMHRIQQEQIFPLVESLLTTGVALLRPLS